MPILTEEEKRKELTEIADFLNEFHFPAKVLTPGKLVPALCLLIGFPDYSDGTEKEGEDNRFASGYIVQLDPESEEQLTKYFFIYAQVIIAGDLNRLSTEEILTVINEVNRITRIGAFFYGPIDDGSTSCIQFRHYIGCEVDKPFDIGVITEAIIELGGIYQEMKDRISARIAAAT